MRYFTNTVATSLLVLSTSMVFAQTATDAKGMLKTLVASVKAKGAVKAGEELTAGNDASKCKDTAGINCMITTSDATMLGNAKNPKTVGVTFPPDMTDVDGAPLVDGLIGPVKKGKSNWEAQYKFALPGTKKVVPQHAFCESPDAKTVVCTVLQNVQQ